MKKISYIAIVGFIIGWCASSTAQTRKAWLKAADESWEEQDYYSALTYYMEVLDFDTSAVDIRYKVATSAEAFNAYSLAAKNYQYVLDNDTEGKFAETSFHLAKVKQLMGEYTEAKDLYNIYIGEHGEENELITSIARESIAAIDYAEKRMVEYDASTSIEPLPEGVNTPYSEFAATDWENLLFYSSHQFTYKHPTTQKKQLLGKIMSSTDDLTGKEVGSGLEMKGKTIANATFSTESDFVIFSVCEYATADSLRCDLYRSTMVDDSTFTPAIKLPTNINETGYTSTQPHIVEDEDKTMLYFVSDRPGGKGLMDIYKAEVIDSVTYSEPVNISINTSGSDITPFFDVNSQTLYFSSMGRLGLGGYDIYAATLIEGDFGEVEHLPAHTNSSYHDIYYKVSDDGEYAYFSSNRLGSMFLDPGQEACCFDIYKATFDIVELPLNAMTFDLLTKDSLIGVTVRLLDGRTGREIERLTNELGKDHHFKIQKGKKYILVSEKEGFFPDTTEIHTKDVGGPIETTIFLDSDRYALDIFTYDARTLAPLPGTKVKLIDVTDKTIADQITVNEDGNDYVFIIEPNKDYEVEVSKYGYLPKTIQITTRGEIEGKRIKEDVYLDKLDLNEYLPVSLYFDNDQPDPGSNRTNTTSRYSDLYYKYLDQASLFIQKNPGEATAIENFFSNNVQQGYVQMQKFYDELFKLMEAGRKIELTIKGHTSPIAVNKYNLVLGQRRVTSVKNDMALYRGGILQQYLENGQIKITDISFGEEIQTTNASDSAVNKRKSVYSVDASLERRVEIIKATEQ